MCKHCLFKLQNLFPQERKFALAAQPQNRTHAGPDPNCNGFLFFLSCPFPFFLPRPSFPFSFPPVFYPFLAPSNCLLLDLPLFLPFPAFPPPAILLRSPQNCSPLPLVLLLCFFCFFFLFPLFPSPRPSIFFFIFPPFFLHSLCNLSLLVYQKINYVCDISIYRHGM